MVLQDLLQCISKITVREAKNRSILRRAITGFIVFYIAGHSKTRAYKFSNNEKRFSTGQSKKHNRIDRNAFALDTKNWTEVENNIK